MKLVLLVGLGGFLGSSLRYMISLLVKKYSFLPPFTGTLLVNIIGSFLIGIILASSLKGNINQSSKLFLATGFCGGFTTFSAFAFENLELLKQEAYGQLTTYILISIFMGILSTYLGYMLAK